jgi:hypothetical protein
VFGSHDHNRYTVHGYLSMYCDSSEPVSAGSQ